MKSCKADKIAPIRIRYRVTTVNRRGVTGALTGLSQAHTQRFQSADSGLDGCFQQKQSVIGSVGSSTSPDLPISYT